ncbi:hypothetical protein FIBSPDRAFT_929515 [Athelia psychrophila]|uniref:Uncharacterized protein n=1 Tax=Athelia psychrophila TaxID=1759441 RepID=A0A166NF01_9AGAM|nr:hypothetical protein FIBSPDRAFT_929515 [Fibularhizoctonia sp. CBS 109695]
MSSVDDETKAEPGAEHEAPTYEPRTLAWLKLSASIVVAVAFMIAGVALSRSKNRVAGSGTVHSIIPILSSSQGSYYYGPEVMSAVFTIIATVATEAVGSVHSTALRSTLIDEYRRLLRDPSTPLPPNAKHRFEFNSNSRLFAASNKPGWANPNGRLMNALMALLLVISYAAGALIITELEILEGPNFSITKNGTGLAAPPIIVFGLSLFLQGIISLFAAGLCGPHWLDNTDMLATTKKQIDDGIIVPRPHRCMRNVLQGESTIPYPLEPSARQPSAWSANPTVKKAAIVMWGLIPVYTIWGAIIYALSVYVSTRSSKSGDIQTVGVGIEKLTQFSWAYVPNLNTQAFGVAYLTNHAKESATLPSATWPSIFLAFMAIQSGLTLALHYCEAIINSTRDEHVWRRAMGDTGVSTSEKMLLRVAWDVVSSNWKIVCNLVTKLFRPTPNTTQDEHVRRQAASWLRVDISLQRLLKVVSRVVSSNWRSAFLLGTKFFCHWLLAQSFQVTGVFARSVSGASTVSYFLGIEVLARCAQLWYLSAALVVFATITTLIANYKPRGPQPAAYGHFQTLADLIDEWHPVVYWGDKSNQNNVFHAGTSNQRLPQVQMGRMYGGELDPKWPSTANMQSYLHWRYIRFFREGVPMCYLAVALVAENEHT